MFYEKKKKQSCTLQVPKDKHPKQVKHNIYLHMNTTGIFSMPLLPHETEHR